MKLGRFRALAPRRRLVHLGWIAFALVGLCGQHADATTTPVPSLSGTDASAVFDSPADGWRIEALYPLGQTDTGDQVELVVFVNPQTLTPAIFIVQSPLGLAVYGFGGTGNENDADITDGFSIVEQLVRASVKSANGEAYYMPGVFSGYTPKGKKNGFFSSLTMPGQGAGGWTLGKRVDLMIQAMEWEFANTGDKEVNVLGFSRGSTAALEFLNRITENAKKKPDLYKGMKINFVGLWDTVKTTTKDYRTDLPAGLVFEHRPLHFIAIDEYRKDFFDKDVLNVEGALQIGVRGVHADIANGYANSPFGWQSMKTAVFAAGLAGLKFNERVLNQYEGPKDWSAKPTDNDQWFYLGAGPRTFPSDMRLHWSVKHFNKHTTPKNSVSGFRELSDRDWLLWERQRIMRRAR